MVPAAGTARRLRVSVVGFDLSDNATGRADLLARLLAPRFDVAVVGPRFGPEVWRPARDGSVPYHAIPGARYPAFAGRVGELVGLIDGDIIYASKLRPTSYGLGLLARARRRRPLVLDVDDWELGFFYRSRPWRRVGRALNVGNPNGLLWTWLMERLAPRADAVTVASRFLQSRFGGVLVPHVRDTDAWNPARHDPGWARAALGVSGHPLVMFLGTPRAYKGMDDLVDAVGSLQGEVLLAIVGVKPDSAEAARWARYPFVRLVGEIAFDEVPRYLVAADVVAVPQRATSDTQGQVPAKLFDAMALGRPIVSTAVSMIPEILDGCGLVIPPGDVRALRAALQRLLDDRATAEGLGQQARRRCEEHYSFAVARRCLFPLVDRVAAARGLA
jgi:glycosyltransferase involved in cell wall biosynthesis